MPSGLTQEKDDIVGAYQRFRDYVEHEDKLVNERIGRTLLTHGFLLASGVLLVQSRVGAAAQCLTKEAACTNGSDMPPQLATVLLMIDVLLPVIALIGIVTTASAYRGVKAAQSAIDSLKELWRAYAGDDQQLLNRLGLPPLTGGGSKYAATEGDYASLHLLSNLRALWTVILLLTICLTLVFDVPGVHGAVQKLGQSALSMISSRIFGP